MYICVHVLGGVLSNILLRMVSQCLPYTVPAPCLIPRIPRFDIFLFQPVLRHPFYLRAPQYSVYHCLYILNQTPGEDGFSPGKWLCIAEIDEFAEQKRAEGKCCGFRCSITQLDANEEFCSCMDTIHLKSSWLHNNYLLLDSHLW